MESSNLLVINEYPAVFAAFFDDPHASWGYPKTTRIVSYSVVESGTQQGKELYMAEGFSYVKHMAYSDKLYLRCRSRSKKNKCKARAKIEKGVMTLVEEQHTCQNLHPC